MSTPAAVALLVVACAVLGIGGGLLVRHLVDARRGGRS